MEKDARKDTRGKGSDQGTPHWLKDPNHTLGPTPLFVFFSSLTMLAGGGDR